MILLLVSFSPTAYAGFTDVSEVVCDGVVVDDVLEPRVFIDLDKKIFGVGSTETISGDECKVVDFYTVVVTSLVTVNESTSFDFEAVSGAGRRSSCFEGVSDFEGVDFQSASYSDAEQSVTLYEAGVCETLIYKF